MILRKCTVIIRRPDHRGRTSPLVIKSVGEIYVVLRGIAAGSGTQVVDVNRLLKQFEMLQTITKQFSGGKLPRNMRKLMGKKGGFPGMGGGMPGLPF